MTVEPLRVYCAGKTHDMERVREVQSLVRRYGDITHDWTKLVEMHGPDIELEPMTHEDARLYSTEDLAGVANSDLVIAMPHSRLCGTLIEIGAALTTNTPVVILGRPSQHSVFWAHPRVYRTKDYWPECEHDLNDILQYLSSYPGYHDPNVCRDLNRLLAEGRLQLVEVEGLSTFTRVSGSGTGVNLQSTTGDAWQ